MVLLYSCNICVTVASKVPSRLIPANLCFSQELRIDEQELPLLPPQDVLEISHEFEDSNDNIPSSSFPSNQVEAEYDEDEINYMNVSPVSEGDQETEESEDQIISTESSLQRDQVSKSPQRSIEECNAESLCMEGRTLLWDLLQDMNVVQLCL